MTAWVCVICGQLDGDGGGHAPECPNNPDRRIIALEKRVERLERMLDPAGVAR